MKNKGKTNNLKKLILDSAHSIGDPSAHLGMSILPHGEVVLTRAQEARAGVDIALVQDCVDGDNQEVSEGANETLASV
jgi:hypothetical protein